MRPTAVAESRRAAAKHHRRRDQVVVPVVLEQAVNAHRFLVAALTGWGYLPGAGTMMSRTSESSSASAARNCRRVIRHDPKSSNSAAVIPSTS